MTTDEIIRRLREVKAVYKAQTTGMFTADTVGGDMDAMDTAIQAVELLEGIKAELRGDCSGCKHENCPKTAYPCYTCIHEGRDHWEFRWPLFPGKENPHEA